VRDDHAESIWQVIIETSPHSLTAFKEFWVGRKATIAAVLIAISSLPICLSAREKPYEKGKLVSIESPDTPVRLPLPSGQVIGVPVRLLNRFGIQQGDILYLGTCLKKDCKAEWRVGDDVEFRREKDKLYVKRPKHGEVELHFLMSAKLDADGKPVAVLDYAKK
jgi:hypothetical protein